MKRLMDRPQLASTTPLGFDVGLLERAPASPRVEPRPAIDAADVAARVLIVALFTLMAIRIGADFLQTGRLTGLLLLASETLVVVLTVFRRPSAMIDRSLKARLLTIAATMGPPLVRPAAAFAALVPELVTVSISAAGLLVVIAGKLSLGRSFGLMPANRGVVSTGMYRLVRHPIYLGYLVTHVAFLAANPTASNFTVLVAADIALMMRAVCEERTLARDPAYREYQRRVHWRVLPGVF